jgi:hypothetical protein
MKKSIEIIDGEPHPMVTRTDTPMVTITLPDNDSVARFDYTVQEVNVEELLKERKQLRDFAVWVADEIFDEYYEDNARTFSEIACRKLYQLGIVKRDKEIWIYEPSEVTQD